MTDWQEGIYGEVVTNDCYKLREIKFTPDLVFDIGANVGFFTKFARELWPTSFIVAVEPHKENIAELSKLIKDDWGISLYENAIGKGNMWHGVGTLNGSGEIYLSDGLGFNGNEMLVSDRIEKAAVRPIMVNEVIDNHLKQGMKSLIKIDCESCENIMWCSKKSMEALRKIDYICIELHYYALIGGIMYEEMVEVTNKALKSFEETHDCKLIDNYFFATKKWIA